MISIEILKNGLLSQYKIVHKNINLLSVLFLYPVSLVGPTKE
jgi:hypothetical protein